MSEGGKSQWPCCVCVCVWLRALPAGPLIRPHLWLFGLVATPLWPSSRGPAKVRSVPFPEVVVKGGVAVVHVAIFGFFLQFFTFIVRLGLLFVTALILDNVLPKKKEKKIEFAQGLRFFDVEGQREMKSGASYVAWQEFDHHSQDEHSPEELQDLEHTHQPIEEVEPEEGSVDGQGVHHRRVNDPRGGGEDKEFSHSRSPSTAPQHAMFWCSPNKHSPLQQNNQIHGHYSKGAQRAAQMGPCKHHLHVIHNVKTGFTTHQKGRITRRVKMKTAANMVKMKLHVFLQPA